VLLAYSTVLDIAKAGLMSFGEIPSSLTTLVAYAEAAAEMAINTAAGVDKKVSVSPGGENFTPPKEKPPFQGTDKEKEDAAEAAAGKKLNAAKSKRTYKKVQQVVMPSAQSWGMMGLQRVEDAINPSPPGSENIGHHSKDEPWFDMAPTAADGFCSYFGGGFSDENFKRTIRLKDYVSDSFPQIQAAIQERWDAAVNWKSSNRSDWSSWMHHDNSIHGQQARDRERDEK
jgi:hypothetical protein